MPSDMVSLAVSAGLSVSVLAGILSGVCYILAHGIKQRNNRNRRGSDAWYCNVCGCYLRSIEGILEGEKVITCTKCDSRICKFRCSNFSKLEAGWLCLNCLKPPESWFKGILNAIQPNSKVFFNTDTRSASRMTSSSLHDLEEDLEAIRRKEKEQVRDFIERIVNSLLGEDVNDASVSKVYNDPQYLPVSGQSPCTAHAALKQFIQKLLLEASTLPTLAKNNENVAQINQDTVNRTYEDLLASAILNKVISSCQNNLPSSSSRNSSCSRLSNSSTRLGGEKEYFFSEETLDSKWKTTDLDTTSISSFEESIHSSSSFGSRKYVDRRTLTIKHDIEEVFHSDDEDEEEDSDLDDREYLNSSLLLPDDDSNWYLQKRQFQGTHSPVPVPMLIPNPSTEAKVLIGDKEIDETSDLSDIEDDYGAIETAPSSTKTLLESKSLIGGRSPLESLEHVDIDIAEAINTNAAAAKDSEGKKFVVREEIVLAGNDLGQSQVKEDSKSIDHKKTDITVDDDNVEDASLCSNYSNTEKDSEYTEKYATLPRKIDKASHEIIETALVHRENDYDDYPDDTSEFEGSYSKREKEKWKNAIKLDNNPYSKENIEKRIQRSRSSTSSLFGPDYYARQASRPAGAKTPTPTTETRTLEDWLNSRKVDSETDDETKYYEELSETIDIEDDETTTQENDTPEPAQVAVSEITSDSDLSYVNCYDVENAKVYKTPRYAVQDTSDVDEVQVTVGEGKIFDSEEQGVKRSDENANFLSEIDKHYSVVEAEIEAVRRDVPIAKPRHFNRASTNFQSTHITSNKTHNNRPILRRFKSESDLIADQPSVKVNNGDRPVTVIGKKKDNTWISKIYKDPNVKRLALQSRDYLPVEDEPNAQIEKSINPIVRSSSTNFDDHDDTIIKTLQTAISLSSLHEDLISMQPVKNNDVNNDAEEKSTIRERNIKESDPVLSELNEKKIVATLMKVFTETYPNLREEKSKNSYGEDSGNVIVYQAVPVIIEDQTGNEQMVNESNEQRIEEFQNDLESGNVSVKDLKKKFEKLDIEAEYSKKKPFHSLTARSIPKSTQEKLRH